jgi:outer membrane lipoprotein-sorting protein
MRKWLAAALASFIFAAGVPFAALAQVTSPTKTATPPTSAPAAAPEAEITRLLADAQKAYAAVNDYTATFIAQERIEGALRGRQVGIIKFKKPFAVYLKRSEGPQAGLQGLYVKGQNDGKMLVRKGGILGLVTFRLDPKSKLVLDDNRHPITEAGIGFSLDLIEANRKRAVAEGCARVRRLPDDRKAQPPGIRYELIAEADQSAGYYCRRAIVTLDPKNRLMIAVQVYDWKDQLIEDYRFLNLRLNVGLTDMDFSPKNPEYGF